MRKLIAVVTAVTGLAIAIPATTASAITASKFSVVGGVNFINASPQRVIIRGPLVAARHRGVRLGHYRARFGAGHNPRLKVAFVFPSGKIKAKGRANRRRIEIVGGTQAWNGAAGKVKIRPLRGRAERFTITVVVGA